MDRETFLWGSVCVQCMRGLGRKGGGEERVSEDRVGGHHYYSIVVQSVLTLNIYYNLN